MRHRIPNLRKAFGLAVDHLFFIFNDLVYRDREVTRTPRLRPERFDLARSALRDPEKFVGIARAPARLESVPDARWDSGDLAIDDLVYPSPVKNSHPRNDRVRLRRFRPKSGVTRSTVVLVLPYRIPVYYPFDRFAEAFARAGHEAVLFQPPYHLDRRPPGANPGEGIVSADVRRSLQGIRQGVQDLSALVQALRAANPRGVGFFAMSLGGLLAGHVVASDPGIEFAVFLVPACCPDTILRESPIFRRLRRNLARLGIGREGVARLWRAARLDGRRPKIERERILVIEGIYDQIVPGWEIEKFREAWGRPPIRQLEHGHLSVLMEPSVVPMALEHIESLPLRGDPSRSSV